MASLAEIFGKELSPQLVDLYWTAFASAFIEQFERAAKTAIAHMRFFPKPGDLRKFIDEKNAVTMPQIAHARPEPQKWQGITDGFFLRYILDRRLNKFTGDIDIQARREACRELAGIFRELEAERDPQATVDECRLRFAAVMRRIPDAA